MSRLARKAYLQPHTGRSTFVHGPNDLIDTPEESRLQLERAGIRAISACFYSHWHPDHTMGRRVWETRNAEFRVWPRVVRHTTPVYLPAQVAADFRERLGGWEHFEFMASRDYVEVIELADGEIVSSGPWTIRPFRLAEDYVYAFAVEGEGKRLLVAPDELKGWVPPEEVRGFDLAVVPMGICEFDPFTGERRISAQHPVLRFEATFDETLRIVDQLAAERVLLSHVEEIDGLTYDDLLRLERRLDRPITFAYDTLVVDV